MMMLQVRQIMAVVEGTDEYRVLDTIEFEGKLWFVPGWLDSPDKKAKRPARIVCLDGLQFDRRNGPGPEFLLRVPLPKSLFEPGWSEVGPPYVVEDLPPIFVDATVH